LTKEGTRHCSEESNPLDTRMLQCRFPCPAYAFSTNQTYIGRFYAYGIHMQEIGNMLQKKISANHKYTPTARDNCTPVDICLHLPRATLDLLPGCNREQSVQPKAIMKPSDCVCCSASAAQAEREAWSNKSLGRHILLAFEGESMMRFLGNCLHLSGDLLLHKHEEQK